MQSETDKNVYDVIKCHKWDPHQAKKHKKFVYKKGPLLVTSCGFMVKKVFRPKLNLKTIEILIFPLPTVAVSQIRLKI